MQNFRSPKLGAPQKICKVGGPQIVYLKMGPKICSGITTKKLGAPKIMQKVGGPELVYLKMVHKKVRDPKNYQKFWGPNEYINYSLMGLK